MDSSRRDPVRDASYEALFLLGGFLALAIHPTSRNQEKIFQWIDEAQSRRQLLRRLQKRGLIESGEAKGRWVARLTASGRAAFSGGRRPDEAWSRNWDGKWRLLTFDLPRQESRTRSALWGWLRKNYFARLQGSVWIGPDPAPGLQEFLDENVPELSSVLVFEGELMGRGSPRELAATAWDFDHLNAAYRRYSDFARRVSGKLKTGSASRQRLKTILREDRGLWWDAVRRDPLLPRSLHPRGYEGPRAWKIRCRLHKDLGQSFDPAKLL